VPIDSREKLNCRAFLGARFRLHALQSDYAIAMEKHGLERGVAGSKRKHIPQKTLYEWRNEMTREVAKIQKSIDAESNELLETKLLTIRFHPQDALDKIRAIVKNAKDEIRLIGELAKDALLDRRDSLERAQLIREKEEALILVNNEKVRADQALKFQAAQIRGLDLVPIVKEILGLEPTEQNGMYLFADENFALTIDGRKFFDSKNAAIKGTGAIDLVCQLTARNFKGSVEYLLAKHQAQEIIADQAGKTATEKTEEIADLKPRLLTLNDLPKQLWTPNDAAWGKLSSHLANDFNLNPNLLNTLYQKKRIWAVSPSILAVSRSHPDESQTQVGVTLLDLSAPRLAPRVLIPERPGHFWLGRNPSSATSVVLVSNPLEAISYRSLLPLDDEENKILKLDTPSRLDTTQVISVDSTVPPYWLCKKVLEQGKKIFFATNPPDSARAIETAFGDFANRPDFFKSYTYHRPDGDVPKDKADRAWNDHIKVRIAQIQQLKLQQRTYGEH
jgi:hypothetical protein